MLEPVKTKPPLGGGLRPVLTAPARDATAIARPGRRNSAVTEPRNMPRLTPVPSYKINVADELVASMEEAVEILAGRKEPARVWHPPAHVDVRAIRAGLSLSQPDFAARFGFSVASVREWEQGRRQPEGPARTLLTLIQREPETILRLLQAA